MSIRDAAIRSFMGKFNFVNEVAEIEIQTNYLLNNFVLCYLANAFSCYYIYVDLFAGNACLNSEPFVLYIITTAHVGHAWGHVLVRKMFKSI